MTDSVLTELRSKSLNPELHVYTEIPKNGRPCLKHHLNHNWWVYVLNSNSAFPHFLSLSSCSNHGCSYETWLKFHKMRLTCVQVIPERGKHKTSALNAIFGSYDVIERIADTHLGGGGAKMTWHTKTPCEDYSKLWIMQSYSRRAWEQKARPIICSCHNWQPRLKHKQSC